MKDIIASFSNLRFTEREINNKLCLIFILLFTFTNNVIKAGKKRAYKFGLTLGNRYNSFLGNVYYQPNIYAQSTVFVRTKMTLQVVFTALYPPAALQKWNPLLLWQPVDFEYTNMTYDELMLPTQCPM